MKKKKVTRLKPYNLGETVVVALGGGVFPNGTPWPASKLRAQKAAELALADGGTVIICSGAGRFRDRRSEALVMAEIIMQMGVSARRLLCEVESIDTIGNAILVAAKYLWGRTPRKVVVVTSPFHAERARRAFAGVLGPAWPLEVVASQPAGDDEQRGKGEPGGIEWTDKFFEGITPGDLPRIVRRLFEVGKPFYRELPMLVRLAAKAA